MPANNGSNAFRVLAADAAAVKRQRLVFVALLALGQHVPFTFAENNDLALTPPMGWNPWNCYASNGAHEDIVLAAAHAMVDKLGPPYQYINLDCGWSTKHRDPVTGLLQVNTTRFPHGMKWLGDQIHALGLKFGMYGAMGYGQCCSGSADNTADDGSGPGCSRSKLKCRNETFYDRDAQLWASWGVDLVKFDGCGGSFDSIVPMRDALKKTGRPIVYSVHGQVLEGQMKTELANFWRVGADIGANYEQIIDRAWTSNNVSMYLHAGKGGWNDPDMLQVGNLVAGKCPGGQSCPPSLFPDAEGRTQFALWCITKAPLLIGTFIHNVSGVTLDTVTNKVAISVNQDTLGVQGMLRKSGGYFPDGTRPVKNSAYGFQIWSGALSNGGAAAALCNLNGNGTQPITLTTLEMPSTRNTVGQKWDIVEAFTGAKQAGVVLPRTVVVGPHDVALWVLTPQPSDVAV